MASIINADNGVVSGSAGLKTSADSTGVLALQTNGTTAVTVDTSQNVGVGTTSPASFGKFGVRGAVTLATWGATSGHFSDASTGSFYITHASNKVALKTDADLELFCNNTGDSIIFSTNATERLRIPSDSAGITFPATQQASSNANTLDDYEEGSWTPSVGGTATYTVQSGRYRKVGSLCTISCEMHINTLGTGDNANIFGAPFTPASGSGTSSGAIGYAANLANNIIALTFRLDQSNSVIGNAVLTSAATTTTPGVAIFGNNARVLFSITYPTA